MSQNEKDVCLVSACLLGVACRYNGQARRRDKVVEWLEGKRFVPVCPESFSGLPIPREPAEFEGGDGSMVRSGRARVVQSDGTDVSREFMRGATESLKISRLVRPSQAILKDHSPSCGVYKVYCDGELMRGVGCFTALLLLEGVKVRSEKDVEAELENA